MADEQFRPPSIREVRLSPANIWRVGLVVLGLIALALFVQFLLREGGSVLPAVAFGSVLLGASLFGVAGAFLAIPVTAMLFAMLDTYGKRYELIEELRENDETRTAESGGGPGIGIDDSPVRE